MSSNITAIGSKIGDMSAKVESALGRIDFGGMTAANKNLIEGVGETVSTVGTLADVTATASTAWGALTTGASIALTKIATLAPRTAAAISSLAGPIGIIVGIGVAGAVALAANWDKFNQKLSINETLTQQVSNSYNEQRAKVEALARIVSDSNQGYNTREKALKSLINTSSQYFGNLEIEEGNYIAVNKALEKYNKNLEIGLKIKAAQQLIVDKQAKIFEIDDQIPKASELGGIFVDRFGQIFDKTKGELRKEKSEIQKEIDNIYEVIYGKPKSGDARKDLYNLGGLSGQFREDIPDENVKDKNVKVSKTSKIKNDKDALLDIVNAARSAAAEQLNLAKAGQITDYEGNTKRAKIYSEAIKDLFAKFGDDPRALDYINEMDRALSRLGDKAPQFDKIVNPAGLGNQLFDPKKLAASLKIDKEKATTKAEIIFEVNEAKLQEARNKMASVAQQAASIANQGIAAIGDIVNNSITKRANAIDDLYARERKGIENSLIPASVKEKRLQALEEQTAAKRRKIAREQAVANKKAALFSAIVNGAAGVLKGLADAGLAGAIAAGAIATLQIAAISSAPIPALAKGGVLTKDTVVRVGEYPGAQSNPEIVTPQNLLTSIVRKELKNANREGFSTARTQSGGVLESTTDISSDALRLLHRFQEYKSTRVRV
jgi:hypothetical protein